MTIQPIQLPKLGLRLLGFTLFTQAGIVVTGALVRLTGSGLGCPTWPRCTNDSFTPEPSQVEGLHKWIEFGNRLLTFVVAAAAIASLLYVVRYHLKRAKISKKFLLFAAVPLIGTLAQAILGGITVLMDLNPYTVAAHFLLSVLIIAVAAETRVLAENIMVKPNRTKSTFMSRLLVFVGLVVIIFGVFTTGAGPHSGDELAARFNLDVATMAWLHADAVWLFTGLLIANLFFARNIYLLRIIVLVVLQILVGYFQWFTGLPWVLVGVHVALAITLWVLLSKYHAKVKQGAV